MIVVIDDRIIVGLTARPGPTRRAVFEQRFSDGNDEAVLIFDKFNDNAMQRALFQGGFHRLPAGGPAVWGRSQKICLIDEETQASVDYICVLQFLV